jgi:hypothetical protein
MEVIIIALIAVEVVLVREQIVLMHLARRPLILDPYMPLGSDPRRSGTGTQLLQLVGGV